MKLIKLFAGWLTILSVIVFVACQPKGTGVQVDELKCEFQQNPVGIDREQPLLQWKIRDGRRGAKQTAWQVIVSDSRESAEEGEGVVWDSGKVNSDQSVHVPYAGTDLESGKTYYWRVRIWD